MAVVSELDASLPEDIQEIKSIHAGSCLYVCITEDYHMASEKFLATLLSSQSSLLVVQEK